MKALRTLTSPIAAAAIELIGGEPERFRAPIAALRGALARSTAHTTDQAAPAVERASVRVELDGFLSRIRSTERPERFVPAGVGALLVIAAAVSALPSFAPGSTVAGTRPSAPPRIIVAGLEGRGAAQVAPTMPEVDIPADTTGGDGVDLPSTDGTDGTDQPAAGDVGYASATGTFRDDGTIVNQLGAPQDVADGKGLLTQYTVVAGDTLTGIAYRFHISATTIYWANKAALPNPAALRLGQRLVVPAVDGLVVVVEDTDTLESLAAEYSVDTAAIVEGNNLTSPILVAGQTLIIPGANGGPLPNAPSSTAVTPTPPKRTTPASSGSKSSTGTKRPVVIPPARPSGRFGWPVAGHGRISRGWSYGHPALDVAAPYGTSVLAAQSGTVVYAGWRSYTGGGNVVWIAHGGGMYTTYNHLASWSVRVGQSVARGQRIAAIGMSGVTTGPHLHFETWVNYPWKGGTSRAAVNPCRYVSC